jgi:hypothetical protein
MKNIETLIKKMIDIHVKDADVYVNKGSLWLIFTEEKKWVIELDNAGNLWYNYHFFSKIFKLISMNVVEKQHYITRWVEDALQNGMKYTGQQRNMYRVSVEEILQKGVKHTDRLKFFQDKPQIMTVKTAIAGLSENGVKDTTGNVIWSDVNVEDVLQNGVKHTISRHSKTLYPVKVEDVLQNGVKKTLSVEEGTFTSIGFGVHVEDTIQNGVKHVRAFVNKGKKVEDAIQNGVKDTKNLQWMKTTLIEDAVQNGVKNTEPGGYLGHTTIGDKVVHQFESPKQNNEVEDVIENSFKQTMNTQQKLTI